MPAHSTSSSPASTSEHDSAALRRLSGFFALAALALMCSPAAARSGSPQADRKLFVVSIGQSNNGLTDQGDDSPLDDGPGGRDAPDPGIFELSWGVGDRPGDPARPWVGPSGTRHVFRHPAQDDQGAGTGGASNLALPNGICMRLAGAKYLKETSPDVTEITLFCGAVSNSSLRREWAPGTFTAANRAKQTALLRCSQYMQQNPDHEVVFWCSLGETDGIEGMGFESGTAPEVVKQAYADALAALAAELRSSIPGAEGALWVQADIPGDYLENFGPEKRAWVEAVIEAQREVRDHIPRSVPVTIFDLTTSDGTHLDRGSARAMGRRMAEATLSDHAPIGSIYCSPASPNSTGAPAGIRAFGSEQLLANDVTLGVRGLPLNVPVMFFCSRTQDITHPIPGRRSVLCVGGLIGRYNQPGQILLSGSSGSLTFRVDLAAIPTPSGFTRATFGDTWNFQAWYRDADPAVTSNFTDAVSITFR